MCFSMSEVKDFKEELDYLRIVIEPITKFARSYTLPMKGKSTLRAIGPLH